MKKILRVAWANFGEHPLRVLLTVLSSGAAACLVIWVASGYDALLKTFDEYANLTLGRYELAVAPISTSEPTTIAAEVVRALEIDPAVAAADPMGMTDLNVSKVFQSAPSSSGDTQPGGPYDNAGPNFHGPDYKILWTDSPEPPFDMHEGRWLDPTSESEVVLRRDTAERLGVRPGDEIQIGRGELKRQVPVTGIVGAPTLSGFVAATTPPILAPNSGEVFVSPSLFAKLAGKEPPIHLIGVSIKPEADLTAFRFGWAPKLSQYSNPVQFQESHDIEEALDQSAAAANVLFQSYAATGIALLVASLVTFSTLAMGVGERVRHYALLRAIGFTRIQVAVMVMVEAILLGATGIVVGLVVGNLLLMAIAALTAKTLYHGVAVGSLGVALAAVVTIGGASVAGVIPAFRATRVKPLDAMAPRPVLRGGPRVGLSLVSGMLLILLNPILAFAFPPLFGSGVALSMAVGFASMGLGFLVIAPAVVWLTDRFASPAMSRLLMVDPRLVASQITANIWKSVGAATALAVGMGLFIAVHVWGYTMLAAFYPGPWAPDALFAFRPDGIPPNQIESVAAITGVDPSRCLPIVVEQPRLRDDITQSAARASVTRQDNVVMVGIDPERAFGGSTPLFELDWIAGTPAKAIERMKFHRGCLVPDHFLTETGLGIGDKIALVPPESPSQTASYVIVGAVRLPGWHWQTKLTGFRSRTHRAAAMIFANYQDVAEDFGLSQANYVWFNYDSPSADPKVLQEEASTIYETVLGQEVVRGPAAHGVPSVQIMPVEGIRQVMMQNARRWIWLISYVPLLAMLIAGLGFMSVMFASVRSRQWELGILRSIGFTASEMARVILVEGLLIGVVAGLLSLGFGILAGWCGAEYAQYISFFGGLHPPLVVPWISIAVGLTAMLTLSVLASLLPARQVSQRRAMELLQEGRGSF